ncbi:MAG: nitrogen fixation protein FixH [Cyanobacteria bacterium]|nr:nitrogen fixation protein FixH [Cyanobacteria bacterium GSL.Bin1]
MKKIIVFILLLSLLMFACNSASNQTNTQSPVTSEVETREEKTPQVVLVSPQGEIPMGDAELILEVQDSASGNVIPVENLDVNSTMPMPGGDDMISKVEVEPAANPGQFKVKTNFGMAGTWHLDAKIQDINYQGENRITLEVK